MPPLQAARRRHRAALMASLALSLTLACQRDTHGYFGTTQPRHPSTSLWINNGSEPEWIDPGKCADAAGGDIIENLFAGLVEAHPQTLQPLADIAERWTIAADKRTYTFYLRPSVWSDGHPLTADDFVYSWRRVLDPRTASRYGSMLHVFSNGAAFNERALWVRGTQKPLDARQVQTAFSQVIPVEKVEASQAPAGVAVFIGGDAAAKSALTRKALSLDGAIVGEQRIHVEVATAAIVGVAALDDHTLQVQLTAPVPYFLNLMAYHVFKPVPRHVLTQLEAGGKNPDLWTRPEYIVSNGAYVLGEWHFKHYFTYEKNMRYWNAAQTHLEHIKVYEVENSTTALNLYRTGELDWLGSTPVPAAFMEPLEQYRDLHRDANLSVYFYWINVREPPLSNVKVRRALSLAIDRAALVRYVVRGGELPTADLVPDGLAGYRGLGTPLFDPNEAQHLLTAAGYPQGLNLPPITLIYNTAEGHKQVAEAVQAMWQKNLGIEVQIENQEWKVFLKNVELRNYQIARMGWVGDYPDANTFLHDLLTRHAGNNAAGYDDPLYDALIDRANSNTDSALRLQLLRQAEERAMAAQPLIPLYVYTHTTLRKPYLKGFWGNYQDRHPLKYMWIDSRWYHGVPSAESARDAAPQAQDGDAP